MPFLENKIYFEDECCNCDVNVALTETWAWRERFACGIKPMLFCTSFVHVKAVDMVRLTISYNNERLKTYDLTDPVITVGRLPENTISIANMGISRRHFRIEEDADHNYTLIDQNSLNATYVNDSKVKNCALSDGDRISVGKYIILFERVADETPERVPAGVDAAAAGASNPAEVPAVEEARETAEGEPGEESGASASPVLIETNKHVIYKIDKPFMTLGSSENDDIFISGFMVGQAQGVVECDDEGVWIRAKKMMGKLKVNGRKTRNHLLQHKDRIEIGSSTFRFMENQ